MHECSRDEAACCSALRCIVGRVEYNSRVGEFSNTKRVLQHTVPLRHGRVRTRKTRRRRMLSDGGEQLREIRNVFSMNVSH